MPEHTEATVQPPIKVLLTIDEVAEALSLGRTYCYDLVMRRQIASIKVGRKRRIPVTALHEFVARQLTREGYGY
jgi:excisionase family DNA binding protein